MGEPSLQETFMRIPAITRTYLVAAVGTTTAVTMGLVNPYSLILNWDRIWFKFEVWRLVTPFIFFGGFGLGFVFTMYFLWQYSQRLEENPYPSDGGPSRGNIADYFCMLLFGAAVLLGISYFFFTPVLGSPLVFMIIYVYSRRNPDNISRFWGGLQFKTMYLPWVLTAFHVLMGNDIVSDLMGIAAGHMYYAFKEVLPQSQGPLRGKQLLPTPLFLQNMFEVGPLQQQQQQQQQQGAFQGQGHTLG